MSNSSIERKKDAMLDKAEARMKQIDAEVDRLKAKAEEAEADHKLEVENQLSELKTRRREFSERVDALKEAGDDAITDLGKGFEQAWSTLSDAMGKAKARFQ